MEHIRVDFNSVGRDGSLLSHLSRSSGPLQPGDLVEAWEPEVDGGAFPVASDLRFVVRVLAVEPGGVVRMSRP